MKESWGGSGEGTRSAGPDAAVLIRRLGRDVLSSDFGSDKLYGGDGRKRLVRYRAARLPNEDPLAIVPGSCQGKPEGWLTAGPRQKLPVRLLNCIFTLT